VNYQIVEGSSRAKSWLWVGWHVSLRYFGLSFSSFFSQCYLNAFFDREEAEKVSELKSISGSNKLPYGTLALGAEGIKEAISSFEDA
jgi:hypothetical protein